ncbi:MAG: hypothetical protein ACI81T_002863 [Bacteroidia bacterium]|jgi:hypothetical protein
MIGAIFEAVIEFIVEVVFEFIVFYFFAYIGVGIRKLFFFNKSTDELFEQSGWNILVGVTFIVGIVILIVQIV